MFPVTVQNANSNANAHHLLTDEWTSVGVVVGVGAVVLTGWLWLDPVAANIVWTGLSRIFAWRFLTVQS